MSIEKQVGKDLNRIVLNVTEWAEDLLREYIQRYVYDWGEMMKRRALKDFGQETAYYIKNGSQPTGQFLESIRHDTYLKHVLEGYVGYMIFSDPDKMDVDIENNLHGGIHNGTASDHRANLLERLNESFDDMGNKAQWRWWTKPYTLSGRYHFFDRYLEELDNKIYGRFEYEMTRMGWKWKNEGPALDITDLV